MKVYILIEYTKAGEAKQRFFTTSRQRADQWERPGYPCVVETQPLDTHSGLDNVPHIAARIVKQFNDTTPKPFFTETTVF